MVSGPTNKVEMAATIISILLMIATGAFIVVRWWMY